MTADNRANFCPYPHLPNWSLFSLSRNCVLHWHDHPWSWGPFQNNCASFHLMSTFAGILTVTVLLLRITIILRVDVVKGPLDQFWAWYEWINYSNEDLTTIKCMWGNLRRDINDTNFWFISIQISDSKSHVQRNTKNSLHLKFENYTTFS